MKKITFLFTFFLIGSLGAGIISDINNEYVSKNENLDHPKSAQLRLKYIVDTATSMIDSYELMHNVKKEIAATNALVNQSFQKQWLEDHPNQKYEIYISVRWASNDVDNVSLWTDWLDKNPTNGWPIARLSFSTNGVGRFANAESSIYVKTNYIYTAAEKRQRKILESKYRADNKYNVMDHLSEADYTTYTNQVARYNEITRDLKILKDSLKYVTNYDSITNQRYQTELKNKQKREEADAKKAAEEANNTLTEEQELRYYEIIDQMDQLGLNVDTKILLSARRGRRSKLLGAQNDNSTFSKRLKYIKSLSVEDQRIFRVGNKKLRDKNKSDETLYTSLTEDQWVIYRQIRKDLSELDTNSAKIEYMTSLTDENKLVYKSGRKLVADMKEAAIKRASRK